MMQKYGVKILFILLSLVSVSCASIDKNFDFNETDETALMVLAIDKLSLDSHDFWFVGVDLENKVFLNNAALHSLGSGSFGLSGDELEPNNNNIGELRFTAMRVTPGFYAHTKYRKTAYIGASALEDIKCYSKGASVYYLEAGKINIIKVSGTAYNLPTQNDYVNEFNFVAEKYPNISAPIVDVKSVNTIAFDGSSLLAAPCQAKGKFERQ